MSGNGSVHIKSLGSGTHVLNHNITGTSINFSPTVTDGAVLKVGDISATNSGSKVNFSPTLSGDTHLTVHDVTATKSHDVNFNPHYCGDASFNLGNVDSSLSGDHCKKPTYTETVEIEQAAQAYA